VWNLSAVLLVNNNATSLIGLKIKIFEAKTGGVGSAPDSDENNVGIKLFDG